MYRGKMMAKNLKWARCPVPGHSHCWLNDEIRTPGTRALDKQEANYQIELGMQDLDPIEIDDDFDTDCLIDTDLIEALEKDPSFNVEKYWNDKPPLIELYG